MKKEISSEAGLLHFLLAGLLFPMVLGAVAFMVASGGTAFVLNALYFVEYPHLMPFLSLTQSIALFAGVILVSVLLSAYLLRQRWRIAEPKKTAVLATLIFAGYYIGYVQIGIQLSKLSQGTLANGQDVNNLLIAVPSMVVFYLLTRATLKG